MHSTRVPARSTRIFALATAALLGGCTAEDGGSTPTSFDDDPLARGVDVEAVSGGSPWRIPEETIAIGDAASVSYDDSGPWLGTAGCSGTFTAGARVLGDYLRRTYAGGISYGGYGCRPNTAQPDRTSIHGVGRAIDLFIPMLSGGRANSALGDRVANWLVEHAEAIGVQFVIWNRTRWIGAGGVPRYRAYTGPNPHGDHIHIEINEDAAAQRTPWYTGSDSSCSTASTDGRWACSSDRMARERCAAGRAESEACAGACVPGAAGADATCAASTGGTTPVSSDLCATSASCADCMTNPNCGYCNGQCRSGIEAGPMVAGACGTTPWAWYVDQCSAPASTGGTPADPCAIATDCLGCTAQAACGWCAGRCSTGTSTGPSGVSCGADPWVWYQNECSGPTRSPPDPPADPCAVATDCLGCTAQASCGWCAGRCATGTGTGPSAGSCGADPWAWYQDQCR